MGDEDRVEGEERELSADTPWQPQEVDGGVSDAEKGGRGGVVVSEEDDEEEGFSLYSLRNVKLRFHVELGRTTISVRELLGLQPGSVIELDRSTGEALDLYLNDNLFGKCEVLLIEESFSVRITSIVDPDE